MNLLTKHKGFLLLVVMLLASGFYPQIVTASPFRLARLPMNYRSWTLSAGGDVPDSDISQFLLPLTATVRLSSKTDLALVWAGVTSSLNRGGIASASLNGITDVTFQMYARLYDDRLLLHGGLNIPSGKTSLTPAELQVAQILGHPLLGFRRKEYGRGAGVSGGAAYALDLGSQAVLGFGAGFIRFGPYTLVAEGEDYQRGTEASLSAGISWGSSSRDASSARLDATFRTRGSDKLGGEKIFQEGDQLELLALGTTHYRRTQFDAAFRIVSKTDNTAYTLYDTGYRALEASAGTYTVLAGTVQHPFSETVSAGISGTWSRFSGSDVPGANGRTFGLGAILGFALSDAFSLHGRGDLLGGSLDSIDGGSEIDLNGFDVSAALIWTGS